MLDGSAPSIIDQGGDGLGATDYQADRVAELERVERGLAGARRGRMVDAVSPADLLSLGLGPLDMVRNQEVEQQSQMRRNAVIHGADCGRYCNRPQYTAPFGKPMQSPATDNTMEPEPTGIEDAITLAGGPGELARRIGKTRQAVAVWKCRGVVPASSVGLVHAATGVAMWRLNPVCFPRP